MLDVFLFLAFLAIVAIIGFAIKFKESPEAAAEQLDADADAEAAKIGALVLKTDAVVVADAGQIVSDVKKDVSTQ